MPITLSSKSKRVSKRLEKDQPLISTSLKRFKITADAESEWRKNGLDDLRFSIGTGQWDEAVKANREIQGKPCLTVNRANSFLRQMTGEERQHRPAMIVNPVGSGADTDLAEIHQGVLRHIEVASAADFVYDYSYDMMLRIGRANWRVFPDYVDEMSFDQEPRLEAIENPFSIYMSPFRRPDGTDPLWLHEIVDMSKDEYKEKYGDSLMAKLNFPTEMGAQEPGWVTKDGVRIAGYWYLELQSKVICLLDDGKVVTKDALGNRVPVDERETLTRKVKYVKHNAVEVLETYEYPGTIIPHVELSGLRLNVNGKIYLSGIVRDYRDAQRIYDFMVTREVEQVDLYSKNPLWIPEGNENHEEEYRFINRKNYSHLFYKAYDKDGKQLPVPQRANQEPPIQAMAALVQQADYDMKSVVGIYGPGPGEQGTPNESAFAVLTRQQQTDTGTINWSDNLNRAITYQGKICLDIWPKLIDRARLQRVINPDDSIKQAVVFNSEYSDQEDAESLLDGKALTKAYDVSSGKYDVTISSGPQYRTARQEAFKALGVIVAQQPQLFPMLGDIWMKYADWPGAHVLVERLKKLLPPQLQDASGTDKDSQIAQLQQQLAQLLPQHNQLVAELNRASDDIRTKRLDLESKERVANLQSLTQLTLQAMKSGDAQALTHLEGIYSLIEQRNQLLHEKETIAQEAGPAPDTPELPGKVEPHVQPITPAAPATRVQPIPGAP